MRRILAALAILGCGAGLAVCTSSAPAAAESTSTSPAFAQAEKFTHTELAGRRNAGRRNGQDEHVQ